MHDGMVGTWNDLKCMGILGMQQLLVFCSDRTKISILYGGPTAVQEDRLKCYTTCPASTEHGQRTVANESSWHHRS